MSEEQLATWALCEFIIIALIIYGFLRRDKLIKFERGLIRVAAVYVAVYKSWRKERKRNVGI